jgi:hypothetical protein
MRKAQTAVKAIAACALLSIGFQANAQSMEFDGSIFTLDPPSLQSTQLEQVVGGDETTPLNQFAEGDFYRVLGRPVGRLAN